MFSSPFSMLPLLFCLPSEIFAVLTFSKFLTYPPPTHIGFCCDIWKRSNLGTISWISKIQIYFLYWNIYSSVIIQDILLRFLWCMAEPTCGFFHVFFVQIFKGHRVKSHDVARWHLMAPMKFRWNYFCTTKIGDLRREPQKKIWGQKGSAVPYSAIWYSLGSMLPQYMAFCVMFCVCPKKS